jgi:hypothetical protein
VNGDVWKLAYLAALLVGPGPYIARFIGMLAWGHWRLASEELLPAGVLSLLALPIGVMAVRQELADVPRTFAIRVVFGIHACVAVFAAYVVLRITGLVGR